MATAAAPMLVRLIFTVNINVTLGRAGTHDTALKDIGAKVLAKSTIANPEDVAADVADDKGYRKELLALGVVSALDPQCDELCLRGESTTGDLLKKALTQKKVPVSAQAEVLDWTRRYSFVIPQEKKRLSLSSSKDLSILAQCVLRDPSDAIDTSALIEAKLGSESLAAKITELTADEGSACGKLKVTAEAVQAAANQIVEATQPAPTPPSATQAP